MWQYNYTNELVHYGILGMKWGVRRFQNKDGTLTPAGKNVTDRLAGKGKGSASKRAEIRSTKGVGSKAYAKASKKLNLTRARLDAKSKKRRRCYRKNPC